MQGGPKMNAGIKSMGIYIPEPKMTAAQLAEETGMPENIIIEKLGIKEKPLPGPEDHTCEMGIKAAKEAIRKGSHGSCRNRYGHLYRRRVQRVSTYGRQPSSCRKKSEPLMPSPLIWLSAAERRSWRSRWRKI